LESKGGVEKCLESTVSVTIEAEIEQAEPSSL
jgi:hypothetical protein